MSIPATGIAEETDGLRYPVGLAVDDADSPIDILDMLALTEFASGAQPYARSRQIDRCRPGATLLPAGAQVIRAVTQGEDRAHLATGPGWTLRATRWAHGRADVLVTAITEELAESVAADTVRDAAQPPVPEAVQIGFWYLGPHGARRNVRRIASQPWSQLRGNYSAPVAAALDRVMALRPDALSGRLLLLHGLPGTGKTTALRTLAEQWRDWCQVDCVLDPELLFSNPSYLLQLALGSGDDDEDDEDEDEDEDGGSARARRWRLLLLEDCDELIRSEAKSATGQALSRLLNLTDGLLGQGRRVLVAITTNEDLSRLHPAVVRPGRCLAQIEVGALSAAEATGWLGRPVSVPATLAELYALRDGTPVQLADEPPTGCYL
jgi:Domain of unknown function (DUF5925)/ATPase family associated with various cellular activities (AAA)